MGLSKPRRFLDATTLWAALALSPTVVLHAAGKPSPTPPLPANDYSMGRAPQNCPLVESNLIHVAYNNQPNVFPHRFWWIGRGALDAYSGWQLSYHRVFQTFGPRTRYGYPQKVFWQLARGAHGPVTVRGWNLRTGQPMWFGIPLDREGFGHIFVRRVMLVTEHNQVANVGPPTGRIYFTALNGIFVPAAGCYMIRAQWKTGSWTLPFAAGCDTDRRMNGVARCR